MSTSVATSRPRRRTCRCWPGGRRARTSGSSGGRTSTRPALSASTPATAQPRRSHPPRACCRSGRPKSPATRSSTTGASAPPSSPSGPNRPTRRSASPGRRTSTQPPSPSITSAVTPWSRSRRPRATRASTTTVWCSIAYYVDCSKAATKAETDACVGWNNSISIEISEAHHWGPDHRSNWDKLKGFFIGLATGAAGLTLDVANFFIAIYHAIKKIIDFIDNAASAFDKFVNELKKDAVGLVTSVLQNYNQAAAWNPASGGFLSRYALMAGLGMILAAFMFLGAIRRAMDSGQREESKDLWVRLLKTLGIIIWAPALFQLLATNATKATADVVSRWTGGEAGGAVQKLTGVSKVTDSIPGGAFMGFILFLFLFIGAMGLWVGLIVQRFGMEVAATLIAFVAGAYVHPRWAKKVSGALWVVVGLILAKPLTMIVLGATFGVINEGLSFGGSPTKVLAGLTLATIGVVGAGLAPFAALRWAPILPTSSRSHDHHRGGGGMVSGAVLGAAGASLASRATQARRAPMPRPTGASSLAAGATGGQAGPLTASFDKGGGVRGPANASATSGTHAKSASRPHARPSAAPDAALRPGPGAPSPA